MKIYIAPMEGVVDFIIRDILTNIGGYDQCTTEFIRITHQLLPAKVYYKYCPELLTAGKTSAGVPVYIQLLGSDPNCIAENADQAIQLGALGIDLNFGCPAKTVNRHDGGASLLRDPHRLFDVISAVKKSVSNRVPVTAKVRLGFDDKLLCNEIAQAVDEAGAHHLTIHARTKKEGYRPPAHWEYIAQIKQVVNLPVIANGDLWTLEDYKKCFSITGCKDIALGRSAFSCPDLALKIKSYNQSLEKKSLLLKSNFSLNKPLTNQLSTDLTYQHQDLTSQDMLKILTQKFIPMNLEIKGEKYALSRTKQWLKALSRGYSDFSNIFEKTKRLQNISDMSEQLLQHASLNQYV